MMKIKCTLCLFLILNLFSIRAIADYDTIPYDYEKVTEGLQKLIEIYPEDIMVTSIGQSHYGRELWAVKIGKGKESVLLIGSHHGREWLTSNILMKLLEEYTKAYARNQKYGKYDSSILDEVSLIIIPMINPDGVAIQQGKFKDMDYWQRFNIWKMNDFSFDFKRWKANGVGIDLNRQYPAGWEKLDKEMKAPYYQFYRGTHPAEAEEAKAMIRFTKQVKPLIAVAYHTSGREIYWYYKNNSSNMARDYHIAKKTADLTGYMLDFPDQNAVGGGFTDWFISAFKRPAMTLELSYLVEERNPPLSVFQEEWNRNRFVPFMLLEETKHHRF
ncbi:M14 family zinc carboxypeptidase [Peribacillus tepidiphilus]|uniref:M14 family zinc carboxypeptidase n=1 Tax=Peribacillus tepidiphilus TaxID=2652445 RepID=UPI0035B53644